MLKRRQRQEEEAAELGDDISMMEQEMSEESTSSGEDEVDGENEVGAVGPSKTKVLVLASRGVNARQRHLMDDLCLLLPHSKKESKFDTKRELSALNELAELNGCNHILFFEARKPHELFIWAAKTPNGPSVRFHVQSINTMEELHLGGNCMKNTRPVLTFDPIFSENEQMAVMQDLLTSIFGVPSGHRKTRPYIDRVMHFSWADDRIWIRNYQIKEGATEKEGEKEGKVVKEGMTLVEIGPRFILHPVRVFEGSFSGRTLWVNPHYVPVGVIRAKLKAGEAFKHKLRMQNQETSVMRKKDAVLPENELDRVFD